MTHLLVSLFPKLTAWLVINVINTTLLMVIEITKIETKSNLSIVTIVSIIITAMISVVWTTSAIFALIELITTD